MKRWERIFVRVIVGIALAALVLLIGGMGYMVSAKYAQNAYSTQLGLSLNAAMLVNAHETHTQADQAVIAEYGDRRVVIAPENYRAVQSCLLRQAAMPLFAREAQEGVLRISLCGTSEMVIWSDEDLQGFTARWRTPDKTYTMHASGGNHWERLLTLCMEGSTRNANIPL